MVFIFFKFIKTIDNYINWLVIIILSLTNIFIISGSKKKKKKNFKFFCITLKADDLKTTLNKEM